MREATWRVNGVALAVKGIDRGVVQNGDAVVITCGEPMGKSGGTNALKVVRVGE